MAQRSTRRLLAGLALGGLGIVAALPAFAGCGGASSNGYSAFANDAGNGGNFGNDATTGSSSGTGTSSGSSGSTGNDDSGQCVSNCASDEDCQNSCTPAPNGSANCCDLGSGTCMMVNESTCPAPADSGVE